jgi:phosphocarrier protein
MFVQAVNDSGLDVSIEKDGRNAPAGSILGVISLAVNQGDVVTLTADGDNADAVLDSLVTFLETDHDAA